MRSTIAIPCGLFVVGSSAQVVWSDDFSDPTGRPIKAGKRIPGSDARISSPATGPVFHPGQAGFAHELP
ncbi:MAG: hypothetical protein IPP83_05625 [Flavobacteriales bacterium]|nr:hypothetical protein [Flavobacteriales bacterium]